MTDPIADMLTRIRNALKAEHNSVVFPASRIKEHIAEILKTEGYILDYSRIPDENQGKINITLKYAKHGVPAIETIKRISRPGLRTYYKASDIPVVKNGLGVAVMTTSKGVMTDRAARKANTGGEILFQIW